MSVRFLSSSSQVLELGKAPPVTGVPFAIGAWVRPTTLVTANSEYVVGITNSTLATTFHYLIRRADTGAGVSWAAYSETTAGTSVSAKAGTPVAGQWDFVVARFVSATNRWSEVLSSTGAFAHNQSTTNTAPTGFNNMTIGAARDSSGLYAYGNFDVAELFMTDGDVQDDAGQMSDSLLYRLAYYGPFSVSRVASRLVLYRSFRQSVVESNPSDVLVGRAGLLSFPATNGPVLASNPLIPAPYANPLGFAPRGIIPV